MASNYRPVRDRPFNLKGGYGFLFRSEIFFRTTQELEYLFFLSRNVRNFIPEFHIRLYDKNSESDFFFPPPKSEYFFQQHWETEYFFRKKNHNPPPPFKLYGRSLSLTCILCKVLEKNLRDHIVSHMKRNTLFSPKQFGFISGQSTSLQLLYMY
jgi:hypothetical protein